MMRVTRAPGVFWDVVDGQTVVCDVGSGELYKLNDIAAFLWDACDDTSVESLTARLAAAFPDQDTERLATDIRSFVGSMRDKGLLITEEE
jgi:Coenzyme PQQ synthesis protein D (PqqD)